MNEGERQRAVAFQRATDAVTEADLQWMTLPPHNLPRELAGFGVGREGELDNATMAEHGFPGQTAASIGEMGRITGYVREVAPVRLPNPAEGDVVTAGMVAHLFTDADAVARWIDEVFIKEFLANVGLIRDNGHELVHAEELEVSGFHGKAAALFAVHVVPNGTLGSTIVDFAVGRVLGVAFAVALGQSRNLHLSTDLALRLERQIVSVALGSV